MACRARSLGMYKMASSIWIAPDYASSSADAVAQMIVADILGKAWTPPDWLPRHYITQL